jgi:hypothetical protein
MGNIGLQNEQSLLADPPLSYADSAQSLGLRIDASLKARTNFGGDWPTHLRKTISHRPPARNRRSRPVLRIKLRVVYWVKVLWASPWSLWGLGIGGVGLLTGGGVRRSGRILEFWGGILPAFLKYFPFAVGSAAVPFGHVVLGRSQRHLEACRPHQLVHVRQYECWGPLFVPTYLMWCFVLWCCGKRPYYDNPFEREAYGKTM